MRSTPSLPGQLWIEVEVSNRVLSMSRIEQNLVLMLIWIIWDRNVFKMKCVKKKLYLSQTELFEIGMVVHLTVRKQMTDVYLNYDWYITILVII